MKSRSKQKVLATLEVAEAYEAADKSLRLCCVPPGLMASGARVGHHQIWTRDTMISLLGARLLPDPVVTQALRISLQTLKDNAASTGAIPNNVDVLSSRANFRAYGDSGLWWIIGSALVAPDPDMIRSVLRWYECHDVDQSGLISMQEGADWQDLFCTRGKGLYLNCLYVLALRAAAHVTAVSAPEESVQYEYRADMVAAKINRWFWYYGDPNLLRYISHTFSTEFIEEYDSLGRKRWIPEKRFLKQEHYYLPYLGFRVVGEWFDTLGNLLAILSGVANEERADHILHFISRHKLNKQPLPSIFPVISPGQPDWRDYYGVHNLPHHYHNGGIWPFIGGFYVAALVKAGYMADAEEALLRLARLNIMGNFNEWHHGKTAVPMGVEHQAWSAGMYVFAYECVKQGTVVLF